MLATAVPYNLEIGLGPSPNAIYTVTSIAIHKHAFELGDGSEEGNELLSAPALARESKPFLRSHY